MGQKGDNRIRKINAKSKSNCTKISKISSIIGNSPEIKIALKHLEKHQIQTKKVSSSSVVPKQIKKCQNNNPKIQIINKI
jgi:hypothetical protein